MQKRQNPASPPVPGGPARRVCIITFGCQMNEADSELIAASFLKRGFELTAELKTADAVVVNTCTVRQRAEDKAISQIGRLRKWKLARPEGKLFIVGCAAQKLGGKYIKHRFPFVDEVVGAKSIDDMDALVEMLFGKKLPDSKTVRPLNDQTVQPPGPVSAYVTIMRGCSLKCSYCIVPAVRGPAVFLPAEAILEDAAAKLEAGAKEIVLLGQTVNAWRRGKTGFAGLLEKVLALPGLERLRFMSPHPLFLDDRMAAAMAEAPAVCPHLHLPAQSGSDRILAAMRRPTTRAQFLEKTARLRKRIPGLNLTTDFIVGFPGESEEDFRDTLSMLDEMGATMAYCTKFSPREGTPAAGLSGALSEDVLEERLERLLTAVEKRRGACLDGFVGREVRILLETPNVGRTEHNLSARLEEPGRPGDIVEAEVCGRTDFGLKCRRRS